MPDGNVSGNNLGVFSRRNLADRYRYTRMCRMRERCSAAVYDALVVPETLMTHTMVLAVVIAKTCMQPTPAMARLRRGAMRRLREPLL